jgi:hypothetical protein
MKPAKIAMLAVVALCLLMFFRGNTSGFSLRESAEAALTQDPACAGMKCKKPGQRATMMTDNMGVNKCRCS